MRLRAFACVAAVSWCGLCACEVPDETLGAKQAAPQPVADAAPPSVNETVDAGGNSQPDPAAGYDAGYPDVADGTAAPPAYVLTPDTVLDPSSHLMWQRMDPKEYFDSPPTAYCDALVVGDFDDWRPATIAELTTLLVKQSACPLLDHAAFPAALCDWYVSSEILNGDVASAQMLDFATGVTKISKDVGGRTYSSRCVRTSQ